ncbi:MAG: HIRAN domain-containing protein [Fusobacterium sp.]|nr:HIRAN domain-containing protein [Fusobacterium sp.]
MKKKIYEKSRYIDSFHIAGFQYYEGLEVIDELKVGTKVILIEEENNPYDAKAVAIYYKDTKLGYVPSTNNTNLSRFLHYGYSDIFEAKIQVKKLDEYPERQFRVVVKLVDNRKDK